MGDSIRIATYDDVLAIEQVPLADRLHGITDVHGLLRRSARLYGDDLALRFLLLAIVESVPCNVMRAGSTTAPAHTLFDIVRKLADGTDVELNYKAEDGGRMTLAAGRSRFQLQCLPREDFPVIADDDVLHQSGSVDDQRKLAMNLP